jgi:deoxycytidine triphosphate deaminase
MLIIKPFDEDLVKPAGYDLRCGESVTVESKEFCRTFTLEWIELPLSLAGMLHLRSSFTREGLLGGLALVDPGFKGQLTITLFNASMEAVKVSEGEPFIQISFTKLSRSAYKGYEGRYQVSQGVVPSRRVRTVR